ncbi:MAG TPA: CDP-glucose 4,6-dehydratase [Kiritimatiellia bacterium]|nr:CDP-glucose 4,6-dehydratase [Kiritimatiellia bacterium]HRX06625.1 CDP-glucose 4,6-dehydratase [Kiritimatiellia bacterium]
MTFDGMYRGKRVWLTGDTGFKGSWLAFWLHGLGAEVLGIGLEPETDEGPFVRADLASLIRHETADIRDRERMAELAREFRPDVVFHLAAQALVRRSYTEPVETVDTNVRGTAHVLEAVRQAGHPCAVVVVTSDKCYENREEDYAYRENDPMGGHDPYSASKGCQELVAASFRAAFFAPGGRIQLATARAGNVIGPGDWAADRIVPDAVRAIREGRRLRVRNPRAVRPWQHVLEPLGGYLRLGQALMEEGAAAAEGWNFGPDPASARTVGDLADGFCRAWGDGAAWQAEANPDHPHEAHLLQLSIGKAAARLGWRPRWDFETTVRRTAEGYRAMLAARDAAAIREFLAAELAAYEAGEGKDAP